MPKNFSNELNFSFERGSCSAGPFFVAALVSPTYQLEGVYDG